MPQRLRNNQQLKIFTEALEHFEDAFAIYDQEYNLIFANSAAFDAMPEYFNALAAGESVAEGHRLQVRGFFPEMPDDMLAEQTAMMVDRFYAGTAYELNVTKGRTIQVRHEKLHEHYTLALGIDITEVKSQQAEMETLALENHRLANTDQLTGLANRRQFINHLEQTIEKCNGTGCAFFVGLIDLNGFKRINDVYGHAIGDALLSGISERAVTYIDEETFIARLGGDEFALITHANESELNLLSFSAGLCEVLREPFCFSGNDINVSASLGWSSFPRDGKTPSDLLKRADYALYKSKYSSDGQTIIFSSFDERTIKRESEIIWELDNANLAEELYLEYQPILDTENNVIAGLEALVRWDSPVLGLVNPIEFIPLAEKTGRISSLTKLILKKALDQAVHWPTSVELHVNISAIDLGKIDVMSELIDMIKRSAYPAQSVILEVTETAVVDTFENAAETFKLIENNGLRLALDDFGMGFSSLAYLAKIPVSCLKIDKYFTDALAPNSDYEKILKTIIHLCESLEINCIIEGVENRSQFLQLKEMGLNHMQGFLFSKGLSPQDLAPYFFKFMPELTAAQSVAKLRKRRPAAGTRVTRVA